MLALSSCPVFQVLQNYGLSPSVQKKISFLFSRLSIGWLSNVLILCKLGLFSSFHADIFPVWEKSPVLLKMYYAKTSYNEKFWVLI
jgi:hypothetical protein